MARQEQACEFCGMMFMPKRKRQKFCSAPCARASSRNPDVVCVICGSTFHARHGNKQQKCCSSACAKKQAWRDRPERFNKFTEAGRIARDTPEVRAKLKVWQESPENPIYSPEVRRRAAVTQRLNGYKNLNWKHSTTEAQRILSIALGWGTEVTIKTNDLSGRARSRTERAAFRPHYYNLDIADPVLKIAIEVDGNSHRCKERQQRDARRESFLLSQGWVLLRFTNKRVLSDRDGVLQAVLEAVRSTTSRPPQGTTSLTDS